MLGEIFKYLIRDFILLMGELGRYPLYIEIIISMFKYLKCVYTNEDISLRNAFSESKH
jgi:hypothetical protein